MITGRTRLAAVIGDPVRHSRSPQIHNAAFEALGLDWVFLALPVSAGAGGEAVRSMNVLGIDGLSVTMPHKKHAAEAVDRLTAAAQALGVCNCVYRDGNLLVGDNTDGIGFVRALEAATGSAISGSNIAVVGAGGAARSIIDAVSRNGAGRVAVVNRSAAAAQEAALIHDVVRVGSKGDIAEADIIVNATSIGMMGGPAASELPFAPSLISERQVVADIVYEPALTPLLSEADRRGAIAVGGLGMLVHQAAIAFQHWTSQEAPLSIMINAASLD